MKFKEIVQLDKKALKAVLEIELQNRGYDVVNEDGFLYAEGEYPVMLIAHMDTVHHDRCTIICESEDGKYLMSPQGIGGDDRCGIYMILKTIDQVRCSVVFTEDEEIGCVGARKFAKAGHKPANLNYIIEYDRKGNNDAVFYSCDNPEFTKFICDEEIGFKEERGSCSDISQIAPALGVAAVNLSSGYYNQHTIGEYVNTHQMEENIERGLRIIRKECDKPFEYIEKVYTSSFSKYGGYNSTYKSSYTGGSSYKSIYDYDDYDGYSYNGWHYDYTTGKYVHDLSNKTIDVKDDKDNKNDEDEAPKGSEEEGYDDFPEMPFELNKIIFFKFGSFLSPKKDYISDGLHILYPQNWYNYVVDEKGTVYQYHDDTDLYYPLISSYKAYFSDGTPYVVDPIDLEEFNYAYLSDLEKIAEFQEELVAYDEVNGTDSLLAFEDLLRECRYTNYVS